MPLALFGERIASPSTQDQNAENCMLTERLGLVPLIGVLST
jgi:hypothetical protein